MIYYKSSNGVLVGLTPQYFPVATTLPSASDFDEEQIIIVVNNNIYKKKYGVWVPCISGSSSGGVIGQIKSVIDTTRLSDDWLVCDGSTFNSNTYPGLALLLNGNILPDMTNRTLVGAGQNTTSIITDHDVFTVGESKQDSIQAHTHNITDPGHTHSGNSFSHTHSGSMTFASREGTITDNEATGSYSNHVYTSLSGSITSPSANLGNTIVSNTTGITLNNYGSSNGTHGKMVSCYYIIRGK